MHKNLTIIIALLCLFSCRSSKDMVYIQEIGSKDGVSIKTIQPEEYKLKSGDNLYVKIISLDKEINQMFSNNSGSVSSSSINEMGLYLNSYTVNEKGFVSIPVLGDIQVQNKSIDETQKIFTKRCNEYLKKAVVTVKLTSFKFSVMGEVNRPGSYLITKGSMNIFEALSQGGDLKDYANRTDVRIIRTLDNGTKKIYSVDLTSSDIFMSDAFYLKSDDIVYVKQDNFKEYQLNSTTYSLLLSTISSIVLILNLVF